MKLSKLAILAVIGLMLRPGTMAAAASHSQDTFLSCTGDTLTCDSSLASATVTLDPPTGFTYLWTPEPVSGQGTNSARYSQPGTMKVVVTHVASGYKDSCYSVIADGTARPILSCTGGRLTCDVFPYASVTSNPSNNVSYWWTPEPMTGQGTAWALYDTPGWKKVVVVYLPTGCKDSCEAEIMQDPWICGCPFQGDINGDSLVDVFDVIKVIGIAFNGEVDVQDPVCPTTRGDVNYDLWVDVFDVLYLIKYAFENGPPPIDPWNP